ncbi:hypothetical protein [Bradyrhizobium sp. DOA1]|uniref:hypothetical protein n=1 Tax=Bradyrhizobium sp. DOA1 TaxID=1126616 RepID=UPI0012E77E7D|nr:hypothetical protein [Bradyrhizobium sp. DOA1]
MRPISVSWVHTWHLPVGYAADVVEICEDLCTGKGMFVEHFGISMIGVLAAAKAADFFEALVPVG